MMNELRKIMNSDAGLALILRTIKLDVIINFISQSTKNADLKCDETSQKNFKSSFIK